MYDHVYAYDVYVFQRIMYVDLLYGALKLHKFSFCLLIWNLDMHRRAEERETWGSEWKPQHVEPTVLDIWCDLCDHEHLSWQGAGSKGGVSCGATRKKLEGIANGDDIKNRPSDLLVPWLVSKHSVLQFSYYQVLFPQHDKVRTLGRASDSRRKILQQLRQKIMT